MPPPKNTFRRPPPSGVAARDPHMSTQCSPGLDPLPPRPDPPLPEGSQHHCSGPFAGFRLRLSGAHLPAPDSHLPCHLLVSLHQPPPTPCGTTCLLRVGVVGKVGTCWNSPTVRQQSSSKVNTFGSRLRTVRPSPGWRCAACSSTAPQTHTPLRPLLRGSPAGPHRPAAAGRGDPRPVCAAAACPEGGCDRTVAQWWLI